LAGINCKSVTTRTVYSSSLIIECLVVLFASGSFDEIAIVAGGCDKNGQVLKSAELYNSETGHWETLADMNLARRLSSSFFLDGFYRFVLSLFY
ncbi:Os05g0267001, partial [Oryza sativa Japonica Group]|uniref:Uncharacterized protein n=2 Tax=Oryza TaxID=4527 RepID=I1QKK0_ORYGL